MSSTLQMSVHRAIAVVLDVVAGLPVFIAGSAAASSVHHQKVGDLAYSDIDVFCGSQNSLIAACQRLISKGAIIDERHERVWTRWLTHGFNKWHTNSLKLHMGGIEVNCIYKLVDGHPTTSLSQVIESFDFGFLAVGIDARDSIMRDMRAFYFPREAARDELDGPLTMLPLRRESWTNGFISKYQGLRQAGRFVKYHDYGYDLSRVEPDILVGYQKAAAYLIDRGDADKQDLASIYQSLAMAIEDHDWQKLRDANVEILHTFSDDLDVIMEKLE